MSKYTSGDYDYEIPGSGREALEWEIGRLKELVESWKGGHSIAALDRDLAKDQIKRLEEALQRQDNAIIEKDAELDRLKVLLARAAEALEFWMKDLASTEQGYVEAAMRDERLLAELRKEARCFTASPLSKDE